MMLSILCRIMEIEEGVIRRGRNMLTSIEVNANMLTSICSMDPSMLSSSSIVYI